MVTQAVKDRALGAFLKAMRRLIPFATSMTKEMKDSITAQRANLGEAIIAAIAEMVGSGGTGGGSVNSVNGVGPDGDGNIEIDYEDVYADGAGMAAAAYAAAVASAASDATSKANAAISTAEAYADAAIGACYLPNVVTPSTAIATIQSILTDATDRDILFTNGTYAFAANNLFYGNAATRKKLIFRNVIMTFDNGKGLKTWTADNSTANRYYNETGGRIHYAVAGTTPNFAKDAGAAFPTADWNSSWKFALMGASFCLNSATSDASNLRPSDMPELGAGIGSTADFTVHNQRYCALCYPTENITMEGQLTVRGNSGHTGAWLFDAIGLWNSDLSKCSLGIEMPSGELWNGASRWWHCYNLKRNISIVKQKSNYIGGLTWDYMVNCFDVKEEIRGHSNVSYELGASNNETWANVFQHWNGALIITDCKLDGMRHDKYTNASPPVATGIPSGRQVDYNGIYHYSIRGYGRGIVGTGGSAGNLKDLGRANCQDEDYTCFKGTI